MHLTLGGRYRCVERIGAGGTAQVWRALDARTGEAVAIKLLESDGAHLHRRERVMLRMLRMPGVVRIRDEGVHGGRAWIAMDLVAGAPFPASIAPGAIRDAWAAALSTIVEVHDLGLLHGDLKPGNVLVDDDRVVLLDFGFATVAGGPLLGSSARWAAPEVLVGRSPVRASDVYALAAMVAEALGAWRGLAPAEIVEQRVIRPDPDLSSCETDDEELVELVRSCLARDPESRPSALQVFLSLRPIPEPAEALGEEDLRGLLAGPDEVLHLRRDGARLLWQRSGGDRERLRLELGQWAAAGARWRGGRLHVSRRHLDRLLARDTLAELPSFEQADEWIARARDLDEKGGGEASLEMLHGWLGWDTAPAHPGRGRVLAALTEIAVRTERLPLIDRALGQVERCGDSALERLLLAARQAATGDLAEAERSLATIDPSVCPTGHAALSARLVALGGAAPELELSSRRTPGARHNALGLRAYREGRFDEAVRRFRRASGASARSSVVLAALCNASACCLELGRLDEAQELARTAAELADRRRMPPYELRAIGLQRCASYRAGVPLAASPLWPDLARELESAELHGFCALTEAAIAWRAGDQGLGIQLAAAAATTYRLLGAAPQALLAAALAATHTGSDPRLIDEARACPLPGIALQALALLRAPIDAADALAIADAVHGNPDWVREVLSPSECLTRLGVDVSERSDTSCSR